MPIRIEAALRPLVEQLRSRYPGTTIAEAHLTRWPDGSLQQTIRYQAPLVELIRCGLVTEEILRQRERRSACGVTSLGEAFHLGMCDADRAAGCWDLDVCTESAPREPEHLEVIDARRTLADLFRGIGVQRLE